MMLSTLSQITRCQRLLPKSINFRSTLQRSKKTLKSNRSYEISRESSLGQRMTLLITPTIFTISVGAGTYYLAEEYTKRNRFAYFRKSTHATFPDVNLLTGIVAINASIFLLWQLANSGSAPRLATVLQRYMLSDVYGKSKVLSMLGSTYSHMSVLHIAANMYVLLSVARVTSDPYSFLHLYTTGGLVASLAGYFRAVLQPQYAGKSLGASGAILGLIGYTIAKFPEARFSVAFVDQIIPHSFSATTAFWCVVGFDTCGLLAGWRVFDHACHLGGIIYGYLTGSNK